ncbi:MAG: DUF4270 domain-containing protein [Jejuia sp.]
MKKIIKALNYTLSLLLMLLAVVACDTEYSSIESDVLGSGNFNFGTADSSYSVIAYNQRLSGQQVNGLPANLLGFYDDPTYGKTTASIVSQLLPTLYNPTFGSDPILDSVVLTIPYYSTQTGVISERPVYRLDSLFLENNDSTKVKPIKLTVYENKYFLSSSNFTEAGDQNYFSYANISNNNGTNSVQTETSIINFEDQTGIKLFEGSFTPDNTTREVKSVTGENEVISYLRPAITLNLTTNDTQKALWDFLILAQENQTTLSDASNFLNHFRGLFIKAEAENNEGSMMMLNLLDTDANVVVYFSTDDDSDGERENKSYVLNFAGNIINTYINDYTTVITSINPDIENGDEELFIKGTEGSIAVIELFNDDEDKKFDCNCGKDSNGQDIIVNVTELDCFKKTYRKIDNNGNELDPINGQYELKRLLNEAHLVVYEDQGDTAIKEALNQFNRLYIYDLDNNAPILDYQSDPTTNTTSPLFSRSFSLGSRLKDNFGTKYKIKVTDHLLNILVRDAENPKLGLTLSNNVNISVNTETLNNDIESVPVTAVISPRGTALVGNAADQDRRIKLKLFYTETD